MVEGELPRLLRNNCTVLLPVTVPPLRRICISVLLHGFFHYLASTGIYLDHVMTHYGY